VIDEKITEFHLSTDEYRESCRAYGEVLDSVYSIFWWHRLKMKLFGQSRLSAKHGRLMEAIRQYANARVMSDRKKKQIERECMSHD